MFFQLAGNQNVFIDGELKRTADSSQMTHTWSFNKELDGFPIEYAYLYCNGKSLEDACPEHLKTKWLTLKNLHKAYEKSFKEAKVSMSEHRFYEMLPESFVTDYFNVKNLITKEVFSSHKKPNNYQYLVELESLIASIASRQIKVDIDAMGMDLFEPRVLKLRNKIKNSKPIIRYKNFGTITGRLTTKKDSFPILTLDKKFRKYLKPNNDWFLELDYNAAEVRTFLALNGQEQPEQDIHNWHATFYGDLPRDELKTKFFSWFYGDNSKFSGVPEIDAAYNKQNVLDKYWNGTEVCNPYQRCIESDEHHALSYLIQSTTWDLFSRRAIEIQKFILGNSLSSAIAVLLHDSVVIDLSKKDMKLIQEFKRLFAETDFGKFRVNAKIGSNLGNMEDV